MSKEETKGLLREWDQQEFHRNQNCLFESENENVKRITEAAKKSIQERIESESSLTRHRWVGAHK